VASLVEEIELDLHVYAAHRMNAIQETTWAAKWPAYREIFANAHSIYALIAYRVAVRLRRRGVPLLPGLLSHFARIMSGIEIGRHVELSPGVYFPHGNVVMDGFVKVGYACVFSPFVTLGLSTKRDERGEPIIVGPTLGRGVHVGTGAKLLGPITVANGAAIGANAVVIDDVPEGTTVVGVPARVVQRAEAAKAVE
jgi:serine O-acetyltransferase